MPIKKPKAVGTPTKQALTLEDAARSAVAYKTLQAEEKKLKADMDVIKKTLSDYLRNNAEKMPNGSMLIETTYAGRAVKLKLEARNSTKYAVDAIDKLKKALPKEVSEKLVETVEVLREDVLESCLASGEVKDEVLDGLVEVVTTHAFKIEVK